LTALLLQKVKKNENYEGKGNVLKRTGEHEKSEKQSYTHMYAMGKADLL